MAIACKQNNNKAAKMPVPFEQRPVAAMLSAEVRIEQHFHCLLAKLQMEHDILLLDC